VVSIPLCCLDLVGLSLIFSRVVQPALFGLVFSRHCRPHATFIGLAPEKLNLLVLIHSPANLARLNRALQHIHTCRDGEGRDHDHNRDDTE
jgi:hypothetical protein